MIKRTINDLGTKLWSKNGALHRVDGPAMIRWNGTKKWYKNGLLHRVDGPAIEYSDGTYRWYHGGQEYTQEEFIMLQFTKGIIINE